MKVVYALYRKGFVLPIGIFDSQEALKTGKEEYLKLMKHEDDGQFDIVEFTINKVL